MNVHLRCRSSAVLLVAGLLGAGALDAEAQQTLIKVCYNNRTGVLYVIDPSGTSELPTSCVNPNHLMLTVTDAAGADHGGLTGLLDDDHPQYILPTEPVSGVLQGTFGSPQLRDQAVNSEKIANGAVTSDKIPHGAVTSVKIATSAVTSDKIADKTVTAADIADGAITSTKIGYSAVGRNGINIGEVQARLNPSSCPFGIRSVSAQGSVLCNGVEIFTNSQAFEIGATANDISMTVTCPTVWDWAISGGYWTQDGILEEIAIDVSRPWPAEGDAPPRSWNVVADNTGTQASTMRVYVVCMRFNYGGA